VIVIPNNPTVSHLCIHSRLGGTKEKMPFVCIRCLMGCETAGLQICRNKNLHNFFNKMIQICGSDFLENLRKSKSPSLHEPTATIIFWVAWFRRPVSMSFLTYRKIREVHKILEEWFFNISETGVSTVRLTWRQGKKQVSAVTPVLREGKVQLFGREHEHILMF
jgi:hypothetical protein